MVYGGETPWGRQGGTGEQRGFDRYRGKLEKTPQN